MSNLTLKIIELIKNNKSLNEISQELKLSNKQIYNILSIISHKGFNFNRKYYSDGNIYYSPNTIITNNDNNNSVNIITNDDNNDFSAIIISDIHIGNSLQRMDLLDKIYNYCTNTGINNSFICGDLIDGTFGNSDKLEQNSKQVLNI